MLRYLTVLFLLALSACGGGAPPPAVLTLQIHGSAGQNPDASGQGTTVAVRLYQLTATGKFQSTDVYTLMNQEATTLGSDEAGASEQILLAPGQSLTEKRTLKPNVVALGVAVLFQNINQSTWKLTAPVAASGPTALTLNIQKLTATLGK